MMKKADKYDWLEFAQSFLLLAKLACQELEDAREKKHSKITRFDPPEMNFSYQHTDLFVPIVFNVKHGLEVFVKTLKIISTKNYKEGHDLKDLFSNLKDSLPKKIKPIKDQRGNKVTQEDIDNISSNLDDIEKLVLKYYHCEFINSGQKVVNIYDKMNDVFRYPDNKAETKINFDLVDENLIKDIHGDIDNIYRFFNDFGYLLEIYQANCNK
jgi:HEPN domain-containing protein